MYEYIAPDAYSYNNTVRRQLAAEYQTLVYHRLVNLPLTFAVKNASTGDSIPNARISQSIRFSSATQGGPIGHTDENGRFHTDTFHPEHTAWFSVTADGYADKQVNYVQNQREYMVSLDPKEK